MDTGKTDLGLQEGMFDKQVKNAEKHFQKLHRKLRSSILKGNTKQAEEWDFAAKTL